MAGVKEAGAGVRECGLSGFHTRPHDRRMSNYRFNRRNIDLNASAGESL